MRFSDYVMQRMSGFGGESRTVPLDIADVPEFTAQAFGDKGAQHVRTPILNGPIKPRGSEAVIKDIADFNAALGDVSHDEAFIAAVTPGQIAVGFLNRYYSTHQEYVGATASAVRSEYDAIVDALQPPARVAGLGYGLALFV